MMGELKLWTGGLCFQRGVEGGKGKNNMEDRLELWCDCT